MDYYSTSFSSVKYHGLYNRGATRYLNSVLQVLFMTEDFREAVERHTSEPDTVLIDCDLKTLFADLKKHTASASNITKKLGIDRVTEQYDAAEYFKKILSLTSPDASQIFRGQLTHRTTCSTCHSETEADGGFWHLPLALADSHSADYDVVQGIKEHFSISDFSRENQMYCDKCEAKSDVTVECVMKHHPDVLMLLLKRFQFDRYMKIDQRVNVPYTLQIPEGQTYELYAVVDHRGSLRFGSYTATIRDNESWYEFNDDRVTKLHFQPSQVDTFERSSTAYLLFYRKMNAPAVDTQDNRNMSPPESFPPATSDDQSQDAEKMEERKETDGEKEVVHDTAMHVPVDQNLETVAKETDSNMHAISQEGVMSDAQGGVKDVETDKDGQTGGDEESEKEGKSSTEYSGAREGAHDVRGNINKDLGDKQALGGDRGSEPCSAERMDVDMKNGPTGVQGDTPLTYHGLLNQGATCYLNSVLQVLFMTEDFRAAVERHTSEADTELIDYLKTLFADLKNYTAYTFNITNKLGIDRVTEQRDAAEYFEKILNLTSPDASKIFRGQLTHRTTCSTCHSETEADGRFWHLPLTLADSYSEDYKVVEGIKEHFTGTDFSGEDQMYCDTCEAKSDATIECVMKHHPDVLMLLLKRFQFDYRYMTYVKINQRVNVPYTLQIPEDQMYELYAVVDHHGSLRGGHYTATIRGNESWYEFNDDRVTKPYYQPFQVDTFERSSTAYLLFYRKMNAPAVDTQDNRNMSPPESFPPTTSDDQSQDAEKMEERKEADGATEVVHDTGMYVSVEQSLETAVKETDSNEHARSQEGVIGEAQGGVKDVETDKDGQTGGDEESEKEGKSSTEYSGDREGAHDVRGNINEDLGDKQALGGDRGSEPCSAERMDVDMKKRPTGVQGDRRLLNKYDLCTPSFETQHSRRDGEKRGDHQHPLERETSERSALYDQVVKDQTSEKHNRPEQEISATPTRLGDVGKLRQQEDQRDKHVENPSGELTVSQEVGTVEMTRRGKTESKTGPEFNEDTEAGKPGSGIIVKTIEEDSKGFQTTRCTMYIRLKTSQNGTKGQVEYGDGRVQRKPDSKQMQTSLDKMKTE